MKKKKEKIFIVCPSNIITGGPEALHQLEDKLLRFGHEAYIYYYPEYKSDTPPQYKLYKIKTADKIEDIESNLLIVPETMIHLLSDFKNMKKSIWWLSVDNAFTAVNSHKIKKRIKDTRIRSVLARLKQNKLIHAAYERFLLREVSLMEIKDPSIIHFAQSRYAENFLIKNGGSQIFPLTDYLSNAHFYTASRKDAVREDIILYNPKKGMNNTQKLIDRYSHYKWTPIQNMTPEEVSKLMKKSKIYIDLGNHPGRDRLPREAAMHGLCVIVGNVGSANFSYDVPLPPRYKFSLKRLNLEKINEVIKDCLENFIANQKNFEPYRQFIKLQEKQFEIEIEMFFGKKK